MTMKLPNKQYKTHTTIKLHGEKLLYWPLGRQSSLDQA